MVRRVSRNGGTDARRDGSGDAIGIPFHSMHHGGGKRVEEFQADEIQAWYGWDDSALMQGLVRAENRKVDPVEARPVAGTPDHVCDVENPVVVQERQAITDTHGSGHALYTGSDQVTRPGPPAASM
jgi:hypothetical protein